MDIKRICDLIEERKEELFELLSSLVKINSENFIHHYRALVKTKIDK